MKFETYSNKLYYAQCDDSNVSNTYTDEEILNAFAFSLRRIRANKNLSLVQLSKMTGIPHQTLSAYERNFRIPTILQALKKRLSIAWIEAFRSIYLFDRMCALGRRPRAKRAGDGTAAAVP